MEIHSSLTPESVRVAAEQTAAYLLKTQLSDGRWVGKLSSSCEATACAVIALYLTGREQYAQQIQRGLAWLLQTQHSDGGWGDAVSDPSNINATSLAISTLHLISAPEHKAALERGLVILERLGGWDAVRDQRYCTLSGVCRTVAALVGLLPWSGLQDLPFEVILLPKGLYRKISITLPGFLALAMMQHTYRPAPIGRRLLRSLAKPRVVRWLRQAQAPNGSYEESPLLNALVVIGLTAGNIRGASEIIRSSLHYILEHQREDGSWPIDRDLETSNTHNSILALHELGYDLQLPRFQRTKEWLLASQFLEPFFATGAPGGGWSWAVPGGWPDTDDTAYNLKALIALGLSPQHPQLKKGIAWELALQNDDGSWSTFVPNSTLPFDQPCPYVTAHVLSGLRATGLFTANSEPVRRAIDWLRGRQEADGSFTGLWFRNYTCATAFVLEAMAEYGLADDLMARRCRNWLLDNQNPDGSWGGHIGQPGTPEETSWAIAALLLAGLSPTHRSIERGTAWLVNNQRPDGTWEPSIIGLYFRSLWYSDSYYAIAFPLKALALYLKRMEAM